MKRLFLIAAAVAALATAPAAQDLLVNDLGEVARFSDHPLGPEQERSYGRFSRDAPYFAAFYVTPESGGAFVYSGAGSLRAARAAAAFGCQALRVAGEAECIFYAAVRPRGGQASDFGDIPQTLAWEIFDRRAESAVGGAFFSVATTEAGSWGLSNPQQTAAASEAEALAFCRAFTEGSAADTLVADVGPALAAEFRRLGYLRCRILETVQIR